MANNVILHPLHGSIDQMVRLLYANLNEAEVSVIVAQVEKLVNENAGITDFVQIIMQMHNSNLEAQKEVTPSVVSSTLTAVLASAKIVRESASDSDIDNVIRLITGFMEAILHVAPNCETLQLALLFIQRKVLNERVLVGCVAKGLHNLADTPIDSMYLMIPNLLQFLPVTINAKDVECLRVAMDNPSVAEVINMWVKSLTDEITCICELDT